MNDIFIYLLFGHFVGDFFLQPKSMAVKKGASNLIAFTHVTIYMLSVILFTISFFFGLSVNVFLIKYFSWCLVIFIPHYVIDRFSLADKWLTLIDGRSLADFYNYGHRDIPKDVDNDGKAREGNYHVLRGGFTCIVYVVVDNVSHLMCLWYGWKLVSLIS